MLTKRIIACLDIKNGRTVKGTNFIQLKDMGDPVELAAYYSQSGVDELVFLDISATDEKRKTLAALVKRIAKQVDIPFTVGGGISSVNDVSILLESGADKISINTAAVNNPYLIENLAKQFGSQCVVLAIDAKKQNTDWKVWRSGGSIDTGLNVIDWAFQATQLGAGELLLTSIDKDGTRDGFDIGLTSQVSNAVGVPVIASGGAGTMDHFYDAFTAGQADAALAAGIFHDRSVDIPALKYFLQLNGLNIRI